MLHLPYKFTISILLILFIYHTQTQTCDTWYLQSQSSNSNLYCILDCISNTTSCNVTCPSAQPFYGGSCINSCPTTMYLDSNNTCQPCKIGCRSCQDPGTNCTSCIFNFIQADNGLCYIPCGNLTCNACPLNWYLDYISNICYPCATAICKNCSVFPTYCSQCLNGTFNSMNHSCNISK